MGINQGGRRLVRPSNVSFSVPASRKQGTVASGFGSMMRSSFHQLILLKGAAPVALLVYQILPH